MLHVCVAAFGEKRAEHGFQHIAKEREQMNNSADLRFIGPNRRAGGGVVFKGRINQIWNKWLSGSSVSIASSKKCIRSSNSIVSIIHFGEENNRKFESKLQTAVQGINVNNIESVNGDYMI